jgi:alpha-ketoglutarate-dependent 2,4-dichlorophenoxyacetate dioxygenase
MKISIQPIRPDFAAGSKFAACSDFAGEVLDADLRKPLSEEDVIAIERGMDRYAVLVFRDQHLSDDEQIMFTKNLGPLENAQGGNITKDNEYRLKQGMIDVSNLDQNGNPFDRSDRRRMFNLGNRLWHSDSSYRAIPAKYSLLSARTVATLGGNTEFADMRAAYDALDADMRELVADLVCEHSLLYSRGAMGFTELTEAERAAFRPVYQRLVRTHPVSGRKSLFLSSHIGTVVGWLVPEGRDLIRDLIEHATQRDFVYAHVWRQYDLVIWDNRQTMHRVRRFDESQPRDMRRTTVAGDAPTAVQPDRAN